MIPQDLVFPDELEQLKPIIAASALTKAAYDDMPTGTLLGSQPASGKTGLIRLLQRQNSDKTFVVINGDALRPFHPRSEAILLYYGLDAPKFTRPFSNTLVEWLKTECIRLWYNFIIEGTMRTLSVFTTNSGSLLPNSPGSGAKPMLLISGRSTGLSVSLPLTSSTKE